MAELAADVALERARLNAARTGERKLAEAIVTMLASGSGEGAAPAEIASLMRAAELPPDGRYLVAAVGVEAHGAERRRLALRPGRGADFPGRGGRPGRPAGQRDRRAGPCAR